MTKNVNNRRYGDHNHCHRELLNIKGTIRIIQRYLYRIKMHLQSTKVLLAFKVSSYIYYYFDIRHIAYHVSGLVYRLHLVRLKVYFIYYAILRKLVILATQKQSHNYNFIVVVFETRQINISSFFAVSNKLHSQKACSLNRQSQFIIQLADKDNKLQTRPSFAISYEDILIFPVFIGYSSAHDICVVMYHTEIRYYNR